PPNQRLKNLSLGVHPQTTPGDASNSAVLFIYHLLLQKIEPHPKCPSRSGLGHLLDGDISHRGIQLTHKRPSMDE
ncbi:MAG: hypothetical protein ACOYYS_11445, partial [Chloroflexota bacterium]